jgi:hypothetical protein
MRKLLFIPLLLCMPAPAAQILVDPTWDPYLYANLPSAPPDGGSLPVAMSVPAGSATARFSATGNISCFQQTALVGPDGGAGCGSTDTDLTDGGGGISGIKAPGGLFLAGVFLGAADPAAGTAPARLDYTGPGLTFNDLVYTPLLNQLFFIGDGQTSSSVAQLFVVPAGATRLVLGWADGLQLPAFIAFHGSPCCYGDNGSTTSGELVTYDFHAPEPSMFVPLLAVAVAVGRRLVRIR